MNILDFGPNSLAKLVCWPFQKFKFAPDHLVEYTLRGSFSGITTGNN